MNAFAKIVLVAALNIALTALRRAVATTFEPRLKSVLASLEVALVSTIAAVSGK